MHELQALEAARERERETAALAYRAAAERKRMAARVLATIRASDDPDTIVDALVENAACAREMGREAIQETWSRLVAMGAAGDPTHHVVTVVQRPGWFSPVGSIQETRRTPVWQVGSTDLWLAERGGLWSHDSNRRSTTENADFDLEEHSVWFRPFDPLGSDAVLGSRETTFVVAPWDQAEPVRVSRKRRQIQNAAYVYGVPISEWNAWSDGANYLADFVITALRTRR
ncbi:MAG TPA: hypothetical protein VJT75_14280 [Thermoleophilaceae bacterium]|nr:hypothetical protein [Thermoleophilaceae bacterium]